MKSIPESREGVPLTNLDQALFDGPGATKRDLVDYLDGVRERTLPVLEDRPLSVIRVHRGQEAFMQKNLPVWRVGRSRMNPYVLPIRSGGSAAVPTHLPLLCARRPGPT